MRDYKYTKIWTTILSIVLLIPGIWFLLLGIIGLLGSSEGHSALGWEIGLITSVIGYTCFTIALSLNFYNARHSGRLGKNYGLFILYLFGCLLVLGIALTFKTVSLYFVHAFSAANYFFAMLLIAAISFLSGWTYKTVKAQYQDYLDSKRPIRKEDQKLIPPE